MLRTRVPARGTGRECCGSRAAVRREVRRGLGPVLLRPQRGVRWWSWEALRAWREAGVGILAGIAVDGSPSLEARITLRGYFGFGGLSTSKCPWFRFSLCAVGRALKDRQSRLHLDQHEEGERD